MAAVQHLNSKAIFEQIIKNASSIIRTSQVVMCSINYLTNKYLFEYLMINFC